ncbi:von Willebrand factor C domain-containing protein 2-like [Haliotis rubra]|uniref:von Willebrand factor C domain-containing protein 2-like n=1 Tax=Haliotis rubra TaxID=36100 RepID=UPI001EE4F9EC|nr:von Willebrand factor C domain-containing protein 2-like [Haliotis rubra]
MQLARFIFCLISQTIDLDIGTRQISFSGKGITLCSVSMAMFVFFFVVFCIGSLAPTAVSLPTAQPGCHVNGQYHPDGSSYQPSACKHCYCSNGREVCAIADCFFTPCVDPVHDPKVCCPVCPNGSNCWASKQIIPAGKDVQIDEHTTCRCPNPGFGQKQAVCTIAMTVLPVTIP